jgi:OFA family oxalate/formate antiporter-like MFS transporter
MKQHMDPNGTLVLLAGMLLTFVLGSVHAFSVFLVPLEFRFDAPRSSVSLTYSLALAFITAGVLFGHRAYARLRPARLASILCVVAAVGCMVAGNAESLATVWLGYSMLFGGANGLGYGLALQSAAQSNPTRKGLAMGLVTAAYAVGAVVAPVLFEILLRGGGFAAAMWGLSVALIAIIPFVASLLYRGRAVLEVDRPIAGDSSKSPLERGLTLRLWLGYGTAVAAGLMAIGHATGIALAGGLGNGLMLSAPIIIALFNVLGSFVGGGLADRIKFDHLLMGLPACSAVPLLILAWFDSGTIILVGLAVVGFAYGGIISVYPAAVAYMFGGAVGVRIYGCIFTAWGTAGLLAPWFAGFLFEWFGDYRIALAVAGALGLVSVMVIQSVDYRKHTSDSH